MSKSHATNFRFFLRHSVIPSHIEVGTQFGLNTDVEPEIFHQLSKVFRCQTGQPVILINQLEFPTTSLLNTEYRFIISIISKKSLTLELQKIQPLSAKLASPLHLALCLPNKPAKLDFILEKATELGVNSITLIKSALSNFNHQVNLDRLNSIVIEAAEQSEQNRPPRLDLILNGLTPFLEKLPTNCLVGLERAAGDTPSLLDLPVSQETTLLIGPEGGFSPAERQQILSSPAQSFHLGASILKSETATLLSLGIVAIKLQ